MPRLTNAVPKYRKHRASGQAICTLNGRDDCLGPHGTKASRIASDRPIGEWLVNDRQPVISTEAAPTITNLIAAEAEARGLVDDLEAGGVGLRADELVLIGAGKRPEGLKELMESTLSIRLGRNERRFRGR